MASQGTSSMCYTPSATARRFALIVAVLNLASSVSAFGQAPPAERPRYEADTSGHGAVLCHWMAYLIIRAQTAACGRARAPADDAVDEAITAIDEFILANSSRHLTRAMLEESKRNVTEAQMKPLVGSGLQKACERPFLGEVRNSGPDKIRASVKELLAVPREPVMNPCL